MSRTYFVSTKLDFLIFSYFARVPGRVLAGTGKVLEEGKEDFALLPWIKLYNFRYRIYGKHEILKGKRAIWKKIDSYQANSSEYTLKLFEGNPTFHKTERNNSSTTNSEMKMIVNRTRITLQTKWDPMRSKHPRGLTQNRARKSWPVPSEMSARFVSKLL